MCFSKDNEICKKCQYYDDCDNKRMVTCAVFDIPVQTAAGAMSKAISMPLSQNFILNDDPLKKAIEQQLFTIMFGA